MSIFDGIEKLITEHGSAGVLTQQLAFARQQFSHLEKQVSDLQLESGRLKAQFEREQSDHKQAKEELQRLTDEHAEAIRIHSAIEFRRGKRTGGKWMAFCPYCHGPVNFTVGIAKCANTKCQWELLTDEKEVNEMIAQLH